MDDKSILQTNSVKWEIKKITTWTKWFYQKNMEAAKHRRRMQQF